MNSYVRYLRTYPYATNIASAIVIMSVSDGIAQKIEKHNLLQASRSSGTGQENSDSSSQRAQTQIVSTSPALHNDGLYYKGNEVIQSLRSLSNTIRKELSPIDYVRNASMSLWAGAFYTPYFVTLYRLLDRRLPKSSPVVGVLSRVALTFVASMPINAGFYCYGSFVHHLTEWMAQCQERSYKEREITTGALSMMDAIRKTPFNVEKTLSMAHEKLKAEMWTTIVNSAYLWIPVNLVQFSIVPLHIRPVLLMVASGFWNGYLSISQHRTNPPPSK